MSVDTRTLPDPESEPSTNKRIRGMARCGLSVAWLVEKLRG